MHLVMFDIDGTLTNTYNVDTRVYAAMMLEVLGVNWETVDWRNFEHVTDPGVARSVIAQELHREATAADLKAMEDVFVRLLKRASEAEPEAFRPVSGVVAVLETLRARSDTALAIATGAWRRSAEIKLRSAGLEVEGIPLATASDAQARTEIMHHALEQAKSQHAVEHFDSLVYIGDGIWDVRAAGEKNFHIIGIGSGEDAEQLRGAGAEIIFPDYGDGTGFLDALGSLQDQGMFRNET